MMIVNITKENLLIWVLILVCYTCSMIGLVLSLLTLAVEDPVADGVVTTAAVVFLAIGGVAALALWWKEVVEE